MSLCHLHCLLCSGLKNKRYKACSMGLEASVAELEGDRVHWDQVLTGIEGS